jgi:RNA polymerase sigma-70 factor (sigma-E family)
MAGPGGVVRGELAATSRAATSDAAAELVDFIAAQYRPLVRTLTLYVGDARLAEDLAQEALARVVRDWGRVSKLEAPPLWVRRVAFNLANSHFRWRSATQRAQAKLQDDVWRARRAARNGEVDSDALAVRRAVALLEPKQRTAIVLRYFEDLPVSEVAEIMGCAEGSVRSLTSRAIAELRRLGLGDLEAADA